MHAQTVYIRPSFIEGLGMMVSIEDLYTNFIPRPPLEAIYFNVCTIMISVAHHIITHTHPACVP